MLLVMITSLRSVPYGMLLSTVRYSTHCSLCPFSHKILVSSRAITSCLPRLLANQSTVAVSTCTAPAWDKFPIYNAWLLSDSGCHSMGSTEDIENCCFSIYPFEIDTTFICCSSEATGLIDGQFCVISLTVTKLHGLFFLLMPLIHTHCLPSFLLSQSTFLLIT